MKKNLKKLLVGLFSLAFAVTVSSATATMNAPVAESVALVASAETKAANVAEIGSVEDLLAFANAVTGNTNYQGVKVVANSKAVVLLTADLDLADSGFVGIGNGAANAFSGTFDGQSHTISNMTLSCNYYRGVGFFRSLGKGAVVKNVTFVNANVNNGAATSANHFYGVVAGFSNNLTLDNVDVKDSTVTCKYSGAAMVGCLEGATVIKNADIENVILTTTNIRAAVYGIIGNSATGHTITVENNTVNNTTLSINGEIKPLPETVGYGSWNEGQDYAESTYVAQIGDKKYSTLNAAIKAANAGDTITLIGNVVLADSITIDKNLTLDLNGKTITGTDNATGSFAIITNKGELTITGNGKITLTATNNRGWNAYSSVISNTVGGKLIVENGTIEHLGGTDMAYAIDNLTNGKGTYAETIINGGTIKSTYRAIRMFLNGVEADNILTINGGTVEGANKSVWMQDPSKNANTGKLTVTKGATLNGNVYLSVTEGSTEYPVEVSIAASAVNGKVVTSNFPYGYRLGEGDNYTVVAPFKVATKAELNTALANAKKGDVIILTADIDYGTDQLKLEKAITLDLGGKKLTTRNAWGGMSIKNNATLKNGKIVHASNTAAIKVWNAVAFEDLVIDVQGKGDANKTIGGIVLQSSATTRVGSIKNVTIKGAALTNGIETYNCGDATENVIGSLENVTIEAVGTAMLISAPVGTATGCTFKGGVNAVELWIKGNYSATLDLVDCGLVGGVYAHDEFNSDPDIVNSGTLSLTADGATKGVDVITLTIARAEKVGGILKDIADNAQATLNNTYYKTFAEAFADAKAGDTVKLLVNLTMSEILVIDKAITLDGNGKTLTSTAGRAINVETEGKVVISNLTINAGERAVNIINKAATVELNKVTATANNNAVMIATSAGAVKLTINESNLTGLAVVNVAGKGAQVAINNTKITNVDATKVESYGAISVFKTATGASVVVNGGEIVVDDDSVQASNGAEDATITGVEQVQTVVAYIGDAGYTTLKSAIKDAKAGATVTLIANVTMSEILVIDKAITLDGNGKTLTSTAGRAINVSGVNANGVTIKNLTIKASGERAINIIQNATNVKIDNVTATAANYTVNVASSAKDAVVAIKNSNLTGLNVVNVAAPGADITIDKTTITTVDNNANEGYSAICLNKDAVDGKIVATNTTVNLAGSAPSGSKAAKNGAVGGYVSLNGSTEGVAIDVAYISYGNTYYGFATIEAAIEKAKAGETIFLMRDVTISELVKIEKAITLDLGGNKVTATSQKAFEVYANATITNGTIEAAQRCVDTRKAVELTLTDVELIANNYTSYGNPQPLTIGGSENNGTKVTMTNVNISATAGYGIITFVKTELTATNSTIGGYSALYVKPGSENSIFDFVDCDLSGSTASNDVEGNSFSTIAVRADNVTVTVDADSTVTAAGNYCWAISMESKYAGENGITGSKVTVAGTINGKILNSVDTVNNTISVNAEYADELEAAGYLVETANGMATVQTPVASVNGVKYASLADAVANAQNRNVLKLLCDCEGAGIVINKNITIDFNGYTYTLTGDGVGSANTQTNGFQVLKDNTVEFKNGTVKVADEAASKYAMLIQNYANLKIRNMTLDGTNLDYSTKVSFVVSINSGRVYFIGNVVVKSNDRNRAGDVAIDVYDYSAAGYDVPMVDIPETVKIDEYATIADAAKAGKVLAAARASKVFYANIQQAIDNSASFSLLQDYVGPGFVIDKQVNINLNGCTLTINEGVGSANTKTNGIQILKGAKVGLSNGKIEAADNGKLAILIQNYGDVQITNVELDGTNLDYSSKVSYTLSINSGNVKLMGKTNVIANDRNLPGDIAIDVYDYSAAGYERPIVSIYSTVTYTEGKLLAAAKYGNYHYSSLQQCIDKHGTATLVCDFAGPGVVFNKNATIHFNGYTYTFTSGVGSTGTESNGFQILKGNRVTLNKGTLKVDDSAADKFYILVQNYGDLTLNSMTLDGTNLDKWSKTDGDSYTLSINSGNVNINNQSKIIANNDGDKAFAFDVCDKSAWGYELPMVKVAATATIDDNIEAAAKIGNRYYATLAQAIADRDKASSKDEIVLMSNIVLEDTLTIKATKAIVLDLNGFTISQTKACTGHYAMIVNRAILTIKDSVGGGKISFTDNGAGDPNFGWGSYTIVNENKLYVNGGTIENLSAQNANGTVKHMYCAIQQNNTAAQLQINGGTISTPSYRSIRINAGSLTFGAWATKEEGATIEGQVWIQPFADGIKVNVNNGKFSPRGVDSSSIYVDNSSKTVAFRINGGEFATKIGCANADALKGAIRAGSFTEDAIAKTNAALFHKNFVNK